MLVGTHFLSSFWMMVIIWFVQLVHYPLFYYVPDEAKIRYSHQHQKKISYLVLPGMLIELASLIYLGQWFYTSGVWQLMMVLLILIWLSTFLIQVPCHQSLLREPSNKIVQKLVMTNWIRTGLWTLKTILAFNLLMGVM